MALKVYGEVGVDKFITLTAGDPHQEVKGFTDKMNELGVLGYTRIALEVRLSDYGAYHEAWFERSPKSVERVEGSIDPDFLIDGSNSGEIKPLSFREQGLADSDLTVAGLGVSKPVGLHYKSDVELIERWAGELAKSQEAYYFEGVVSSSVRLLVDSTLRLLIDRAFIDVKGFKICDLPEMTILRMLDSGEWCLGSKGNLVLCTPVLHLECELSAYRGCKVRGEWEFFKGDTTHLTYTAVDTFDVFVAYLRDGWKLRRVGSDGS